MTDWQRQCMQNAYQLHKTNLKVSELKNMNGYVVDSWLIPVRDEQRTHLHRGYTETQEFR